MLIFDLHNSLSFKIRTCTWSSLNENEAWKLNVHNTSASFSFNFDHVHVLILNDYAWFWIILNHIMDVHVTEIECKWSVNVQEGPQFCYILIAKVVGISHTWGLSFDSWDWVLSSMRTNFFESQGIIKRNKENYCNHDDISWVNTFKTQHSHAPGNINFAVLVLHFTDDQLIKNV